MRIYSFKMDFSGFIFSIVLMQLIMISTNSNAQQPAIDFKTVDQETYRHFIFNDWDSLIYTGKKALNNGTDYFYLRYRLGMAYFNRGNYMMASQHLEKSLKFNSLDESAMEKLYFSYLFTNRQLEANALTNKFPARLNEKLNTKKNKLIENVYFEPGYTFSNNIEKNEKETLNDIKGNATPAGKEEVLYGQQDLNDDKSFFNIGTKLCPSRKFSVYLGYGFLATSKLKQIQTSEIDSTGILLIPLDEGFINGINYDTLTELFSKTYTLYQNEAYANAQINVWKGFIVTPAFHYLNVHFNTIYASSQLSDFYLQEIDTIPIKRMTYEIIEKDTSFNNYVASLSVSKNLSLFNLSMNSTWSNLNNKEQYQAGAMVVCYPYGNLDLYTTTSVVSIWQDNINRFIVEQQVGVKMLRKLWVEGFVTLGEMQNYNEKNAFIVYNTGDKIKFRAGTDFIIILSNNIELSFRYRFTAEEGKLFRYKSSSHEEIKLDYQNNTLTGGIKWKL
jgi:hypothetical protein